MTGGRRGEKRYKHEGAGRRAGKRWLETAGGREYGNEADVGNPGRFTCLQV